MKAKIGIAAIFLLTLCAVSYFQLSNTDDEILFNSWKEKLGVSFSPEENIYRMQVFQANLAKINAHNSKIGTTHKEALNQFAFLTQEQFAAQYLSFFKTQSNLIIQQTKTGENEVDIDWVKYGAVSPVMNQGQCDASYAFSAIGAVEGLSVIFYQKAVTYSVQQMIDCTRDKNYGCKGGVMETCFTYIKDNGVANSSIYPYKGVDQNCTMKGGSFKIGNYSSISQNCNLLYNALATRPISVVVDANNFQFYNSGIFTNCGQNLSLGVLLVKSDSYAWTLKNSWGTSWGEAGFIRIARGNTCGVCLYASYPQTI